MSRLKRLIQEIHRRSLWQVLGIYRGGAWVALQGIETLVELNHAARRRDPLIIMIGVSPMLDCVRSDPRLQDLLRAINWPGLEE